MKHLDKMRKEKEKKKKKERKIETCPDGLSGTRGFLVFTRHGQVPPQVIVLGIPSLAYATTKPGGSEEQSNLPKVTEQ